MLKLCGEIQGIYREEDWRILDVGEIGADGIARNGWKAKKGRRHGDLNSSLLSSASASKQ